MTSKGSATSTSSKTTLATHIGRRPSPVTLGARDAEASVGGPTGWARVPVAYPCRLIRLVPSSEDQLRSMVSFVDSYRARYDVTQQRTLFATTRHVLMLSLVDAIEIEDGAGGWAREPSLLLGPRTDPQSARMRGTHRGLHVELDPLASYRLFGRPASDLAGEVVETDSIASRLWNQELAERLVTADDHRMMVTVLRDVLQPLAAQRPRPDPLVVWLWGELVASGGRARIGELVRRSGYSHRHVVTRFRALIGSTPKVAARLLRFERAARLLVAGRTPAEVAATCGYADQSHLSRETVSLSGLTPAMLARSSPDGRTLWRPATPG